MSDSSDLCRKMSLVLGAGVALALSTEAAASVAHAPPADALSAIRAAVKGGKLSLGQARFDDQGRLQLAQFSDTWNKWNKEWSDKLKS